MSTKRKQYTAAIKAQVVLTTLKGDPTIHELASQLGVHPTLIQDWNRHLLTTAEQVFVNGVKADTTVQAEAHKAELFEQIGPLTIELEWLKKSRTCLLSNGGGSLTLAILACVSVARAHGWGGNRWRTECQRRATSGVGVRRDAEAFFFAPHDLSRGEA